MIKLLKHVFVVASVFLLMCSCSSEEKLEQENTIETFDDLNGSETFVITGSIQDLLLSEKWPGIKIMRVATTAECIAGVVSGNGDFFVTDSAMIIGADIEKRALKVEFSSDLFSGDAAFGFRQNNQSLCDSLNAFMAMLHADGTWDEIMDRWTKGDVHSAKLPHLDIPDQRDPINVGTFNNFPFSFIGEEGWKGLEIEILNRFSEYSGRPIKYMSYDFGAMIAALVSNKIDIISSFMYITPERSKQVLFSDPYYSSNAVVVGRDKDVVSAVAGNGGEKNIFEKVAESFKNNFIVESRWKLLLSGLWETVIISILSILIGSVLGALVCWMRMNKRKLLNTVAKVYIDVVRGIPLLVFLMILFYIVFASSRVTARWVAIIAFAMYFASYVSEMFRAGIEGIDRGQTEAGLALGFTSFKTFCTIVAPQVVKNILPVYTGQAVSLLKDTSIVGYIAIQDLTKVSDIVRSRTFDAFFPLIVISIIYFLLAWLMNRGLGHFGKHSIVGGK